jgi:hypothetical protein
MSTTQLTQGPRLRLGNDVTLPHRGAIDTFKLTQHMQGR